MQSSANTPHSLLPHWSICAALLALLVGYNVVCHVWAADIRLPLEEQQRVLFRTVLYMLAIIVFPLANLTRHILLRLNQTMPGDKPPARRYLLTIAVTQAMVAGVGLFGPIMFVLGDDYNTLYIFSVLGLLGIFLHRPKSEDCRAIAAALAAAKPSDAMPMS